EWSRILNGLAPQPTRVINGKNVFILAEKEYKNGQWIDMETPVPGDGNALLLESVKPNNALGYFSAPDELDALKNTIDMFSNNWGLVNNFPKLPQIAVNSRYPAATITQKLAPVIGSQMKANMLIHDNVHGLEKAGAIAAVNEMLLLRDKGVTVFFPNWLPDRDASFKRLCAGTFEISASYNGAEKRMEEGATIYSKQGLDITLACPWEKMVLVDMETGAAVTPKAAGTAPNHPETVTYTYETVKGRTYALYSDTELPPPILYGDVNGDEKVDINDARLILQYLVDKYTIPEDRMVYARVNGGDTVTISDARLLLQFIVDKIDKFPADKS
ncbi:MAG: dockerin type I repeat-containing protein, partial [Oscillospiraceae bacterium]|nr:dockerin type I repeat-containing protein [Oscillospiraceae bacterium]